MHILYIHQHFAVPKGSTGTRSYEFARRWIKAGHRVTLITGYYDIGGLEPGAGLVRKQTIEGIDVVIVGTQYSSKQSYPRRIISFVSFVFVSICVGLGTRGVEAIYATSTPLTVGIPAIVLRWLKRVPFVFEIRDQWPEVPVEMGIVRNRVLIKALLWLERLIYENSSAVVALSPGQAEGVRRVLTEKKLITVIPNSCDIDVFRPDIEGSTVRQRMGWGGKFVFLHAGAMGSVNDLDFVVDAAVRLRENPEILFVLLGEGSRKLSLESRVRELGLANIEILPSVPKRTLPEIFAAVDVGLVIIGNFPIIQHNSSNKFFDALAAGKPVLLNYSGWQRRILEENDAGFGCKLHDVDEFVSRVLYLSSHRNEVARMGQNARRIAEEKFARDRLARQVLNVISSIIK